MISTLNLKTTWVSALWSACKSIAYLLALLPHSDKFSLAVVDLGHADQWADGQLEVGVQLEVGSRLVEAGAQVAHALGIGDAAALQVDIVLGADTVVVRQVYLGVHNVDDSGQAADMDSSGLGDMDSA